VITKIYNDEGELLKEVVEKISTGEVIKIVEYDGNGNPETTTIFNYDKDNGVIVISVYRGDENGVMIDQQIKDLETGRILEEHIYNIETGEEIQKVVYEYNEEDGTVTITTYDSNGEAIIRVIKEISTGRVLEKEYLVTGTKTVTEYNVDENRVIITVYVNGVKTSQTVKELITDRVLYKYSYDESGELIETTEYLYQENGIVLEVTHQGDISGRILSEVEKDSRTGRIVSKRIYHYDDEVDETTGEIISYAENPSWVEKVEYSYDVSNDKLIITRYNETTGVKISEEERTLTTDRLIYRFNYDENGDIESSVIEVYDAQNDRVYIITYQGDYRNYQEVDLDNIDNLDSDSGIIGVKVKDLSSGLVVEEYKFDSALNGYKHTVYEYDFENNKVNITVYSPDGSVIKEESKDFADSYTIEGNLYVYNIYSSDGKLQETIYRDINTGDIVKEISYMDNGEISTIKEYQYDIENDRVVITTYNGDNIPLSELTKELSTGRVLERVEYNKYGEVEKIYSYEYLDDVVFVTVTTKDGEILYQETKDFSGRILERKNYEYGYLESIIQYEYDFDNDKVTVYVYDSEGNLKQEKLFEISTNKTLEVKNYDEQGDISSTVVYEYDASNDEMIVKTYDAFNNLIKEEIYRDSTNQLIEVRTYESGIVVQKALYQYDYQNNELTISYYNKDGILTSQVVKSIDDNRVRKKTTYDEDGNIEEIKIYTYNVEANRVEIRIYDKDNNLIRLEFRNLGDSKMIEKIYYNEDGGMRFIIITKMKAVSL